MKDNDSLRVMLNEDVTQRHFVHDVTTVLIDSQTIATSKDSNKLVI